MAPRPHVLIIGGGVAGLTLAGALDPERWRLTVVEGRPERAAYGSALLLWPSAVRALERLGHADRLAGSTCPAGGVSLRSPGGTLLARHDGGSPLRLVARPDLLAMLDAAVPAEAERRTEEVADPFALADELGADLVVGADGVRSIVRRATWPGSDPTDTGWVALRGVLDGTTSTTTEYWGPGQLFGITPHPHGTNWFAAFRSDAAPEDAGAAPLLADATERFASWAPEVGEVLARVTPRTAGAQRLLVTPPRPRLVAERAGHRAVLLGDAAHAMTPNLGRGACEAIRDAAVLAQMLERHGPTRGPAGYERRRLLLGQGFRLAATPALRVATTTRLAPLRDRALRAVAGRRDTRRSR